MEREPDKDTYWQEKGGGEFVLIVGGEQAVRLALVIDCQSNGHRFLVAEEAATRHLSANLVTRVSAFFGELQCQIPAGRRRPDAICRSF
jgi:hypothetical protein